MWKCQISNFNFQLSTDQLIQITYFDYNNMLWTKGACTAAQVPFPRTPSSSGSEPSLQGIMFRPAVLLNLAGRLDLSGLLILAGTSWQLMQHS